LSLGYNKVTDLLSGDNVTAAANLSGLLSVTGGLLIYTVKKWRSRVKKSAPLAEPVDGRPAVRIEFEDGSSIEIPTEVVDLDRNIAVRKSLNELVRPLHADGIEQLRMRREEITIAQVEAADVEAFEVTELEDRREVLVSNERNEYLTILNLAFQAGNKWRLSDGRSAFYATMRDAQFLQLVERGERFSKHDVLHCHIRQTQWRDDEGLHSDTEVIRVLQHLPHNPNAQGALFEGE
jgi:hypothetical protein